MREFVSITFAYNEMSFNALSVLCMRCFIITVYYPWERYSQTRGSAFKKAVALHRIHATIISANYCDLKSR